MPKAQCNGYPSDSKQAQVPEDPELQDLPAPVLAYCRSGTRCTVLWALGQAGSQDEEDILTTASAAGYSLESLRERLAERARQSGKNA